MSDMGIFSPEAFRQDGVAATVAPSGYINKYGSRGVVAPEISLERQIRATYMEIEDEVDRLAQISDQLALETDRSAIVGSELGLAYEYLNAGLEYFIDQLNDQGASIRGEQVTVAGLIAPDAKIKVKDTRIGNFEIEGTRTFRDGQDLLKEVLSQDSTLYVTAIGNSGFGVDDLPTAFEELTGSIEARPEIEAGREASSQEVEELNAEIDRLQADADVLRASISEVDTKGKQPDPATPEAQVGILESVLQRHITDNRFDFRMRTNRLRETRERLGIAPTVEAVSEYASPEVRTARNIGATPSAGPAAVAAAAAAPAAATPVASPVSRPPTEDGRTAPAPPPSQAGPGGAFASFQEGLAALKDIDLESPGGQLIQEAFGADGVVTTGGGNKETSGLGGTPQLTATQIRDANETEVYRILTERFGGFSFFLQKHDSRLQVGITVNGEIVEADDERADTVKNILDVMVERGIVDPGLIRGLVQKTEWWKTTDAKMREYDVLTADMSEPQKLEYLEPVLDLLREEAQYLGLDLDPQLARELAETITRFGEEGDIEFIRDTLVKEAEFNSAKATMSDFAAQRDRIVALSKKYFTPISADRAAGYAQEIYVGTKTMGQVEQIFKETIANTMPGLRNALDAGVTPDEYYAPYKYEIERMLGRPNIDLYEEFGDVIQHIPEGGGQARPMTLSELRRYVRGLPEWQQSTQGKDSARALAFAIGKTFGEVA